MINVRVRDYLRETNLVQSRLFIALLLIFTLASILVFRLSHLQIVEYDRLETLSTKNRIRLEPLPPVRGQIYDRDGKIIVENIPMFSLEVIPDRVKNMKSLLNAVGEDVELSERELTRFKKMIKRRPGFEPQLLKTNLSDEEASRFAINQHRHAGISLKARLQRYYPFGEEMGHVIGYVGRISPKDLDRVSEAEYRGTDYIGKLGIEAFYEHDLLGKVGYEQVETNAHGRIIRQLSEQLPTAGKNLYLSIDTELQRFTRELMGDYRGAVVAIEPASGEVLALVSNPTYDTNPFVNGIDVVSYQKLRNSEEHPLLNRALYGRYAPGSIIKGFMALVGLEAGFGTGRETFCNGWYTLPDSTHRYRCWNKTGHGTVNLHKAITESCDVYFYDLAVKLGIDRINPGMSRFGFGVKTGVDLPDEPSALLPSRQWKERTKGAPWYPGETVISGIGQGYMLVTPLQLAAAVATLANRGRRFVPHLVKAVVDPTTGGREEVAPLMVDNVKLKSQSFYKEIIRGMVSVVHGRRGTARKMGLDSPYRIAGKTGTAQVIGIRQDEKYEEENVAEKFRDHSLFIAFAPVEKPRIALAVVVENGGSGSRTAAPIARKVMDYYLLPRGDNSPESPPTTTEKREG